MLESSDVNEYVVYPNKVNENPFHLFPVFPEYSFSELPNDISLY